MNRATNRSTEFISSLSKSIKIILGMQRTIEFIPEHSTISMDLQRSKSYAFLFHAKLQRTSPPRAS